jgi:LysM repeat protein
VFGGRDAQRRPVRPGLAAGPIKRFAVVVVAVILAGSAAACGRPAPELATTDGRDATNPSAVGVRAVSVETVVPPAPTASSSTTTAVTSSPMASGTYVVESGDTLSVIAEENGVSLAALLAANNITDPDSISPGQELIIPGADS